MELNGATMNDEPVNGDPANYNRLVVSGPGDIVSADDQGRLATWLVTFNAELILLDALISDVLRTSGPTITTKTATDILSTTDPGLVLGRLRGATTSEGVSVLDALLASRLRFRTNSELVTTLDLTPLSRYRGALFSDLLPIVDAAGREMQWTRQFTEVISLFEDVIAAKIKPRLSTETIVVDDAGRRIDWEVLFDAPLTVIDQIISSVISGGGAIVRIASDAIVITDGATRALLRGKTLLESASLTEGGFGRSIEYNATYTDPVDVLDERIIRRLRTVQTSEGITLLDLIVSSSTGNRIATASDAVLVGDQTLASRFRGRTAADLLGLSDAQFRSLQRLLERIDSATLSDNTANIRFSSRDMQQFASVTDEAVRSILFAILYDVRPMLRVAPEFLLGSRDPIVLRSRDPIELRAH